MEYICLKNANLNSDRLYLGKELVNSLLVSHLHGKDFLSNDRYLQRKSLIKTPPFLPKEGDLKILEKLFFHDFFPLHFLVF